MSDVERCVWCNGLRPESTAPGHCQCDLAVHPYVPPSEPVRPCPHGGLHPDISRMNVAYRAASMKGANYRGSSARKDPFRPELAVERVAQAARQLDGELFDRRIRSDEVLARELRAGEAYLASFREAAERVTAARARGVVIDKTTPHKAVVEMLLAEAAEDVDPSGEPDT